MTKGNFGLELELKDANEKGTSWRKMTILMGVLSSPVVGGSNAAVAGEGEINSVRLNRMTTSLFLVEFNYFNCNLTHVTLFNFTRKAV